MTLVRRQLIEANPSASSGGDAFRFTHVLIQEAAYEGVPKELRADLHARLARRLGSSSESEDEIVGFHLERSYRCRAELGLVGEPERQLAAQATERLEAAGHKAFMLGDPEACSNLLGRAVRSSHRMTRPALLCYPRSARLSSKPGTWRKPIASSRKPSSDRRAMSSSTHGRALSNSSSAYRRTRAQSTTCNAWRTPG